LHDKNIDAMELTLYRNYKLLIHAVVVLIAEYAVVVIRNA